MEFLISGSSLKDLQEMIARLAFAFIMHGEERNAKLANVNKAAGFLLLDSMLR